LYSYCTRGCSQYKPSFVQKLGPDAAYLPWGGGCTSGRSDRQIRLKMCRCILKKNEVGKEKFTALPRVIFIA
jgi:hypothetical protein